MKMFLYLILGIIQGVTEPLPISSSGHLLLFKGIFSHYFFNDLNLEIFLNFSSFLAILIIYRKEIIELLIGLYNYLIKNDKGYYNDFKYILLIVIGTIPVGIVGILFKSLLENILFSNIWILSFGFLITALLLIAVSYTSCSNKTSITYLDALIVGCFQTIAIFPGISRSGMTLIGALLCKINRENALKFSFFLYFPVSMLSLFLTIKDINTTMVDIKYYFFSFMFAFLATIFSYNILKKLVLKNKLWYFSIYLVLIFIISILIL